MNLEICWTSIRFKHFSGQITPLSPQAGHGPLMVFLNFHLCKFVVFVKRKSRNCLYVQKDISIFE